MEDTARFGVPVIFSNPTGWGPPEASIPKQFTDLPFAPFSKNDRVGGVADLSGTYSAKYRKVEESEFHLVDSRPSQKKKGFKNRQTQWKTKKVTARRRAEVASSGQAGKQTYGKYDQQQRRRAVGPAGGGAWGARTGAPPSSKYATAGPGGAASSAPRSQGAPPPFRRFDRDKVIKESSVEVKADWTVVEQVDFTQLAKLRDDVPEPTNIVECGAVGYYDKTYDKISTKAKKALKRIDKAFFKETTTDDPIIKRLSLEENFEGNVIFGTDAIISALMCSPRSHYSWDIVVRRVGPKLLFFDKRDKSQFDYLTVNETASEPPREDDKETINTPSKLSHEASYINQNFSQQVLTPSKEFSFSEPNPFQGSLSNEEVASVAYRYRRWDLGDGNVLICRCEVDCAVEKAGRTEFATVKALNEYDPKAAGTDWRHKLDSQRGGVLATELKNNSFKLARWTAQALLAGTEELKLGWVSRVTPKDAFSHQLLGLQTWRPTEFANQINLSEQNMWGILRFYIDMCMALEPGTYLFLKDPNKRLVRLYQVNDDAFVEGEAYVYPVDDDEDNEDED